MIFWSKIDNFSARVYLMWRQNFCLYLWSLIEWEMMISWWWWSSKNSWYISIWSSSTLRRWKQNYKCSLIPLQLRSSRTIVHQNLQEQLSLNKRIIFKSCSLCTTIEFWVTANLILKEWYCFQMRHA